MTGRGPKESTCRWRSVTSQPAPNRYKSSSTFLFSSFVCFLFFFYSFFSAYFVVFFFLRVVVGWTANTSPIPCHRLLTLVVAVVVVVAQPIDSAVGRLLQRVLHSLVVVVVVVEVAGA